MADKRLDQENVLTDFDYALIVKGTDVAKISKADLAKVVGGLIPKKGSVFLNAGQTHNLGSIRGFITIRDSYYESSDTLFWYSGTKVTSLGSGVYGHTFALEHSTSGLILRNKDSNRREYQYVLLLI